ncbi:MAG: radical SAM protein [Myxococcota bacterium]|nr:radical SAM protein [Myxococcota bacterium]
MQLVLARPPRRNSADAGLSVPPLGLAYIAAMARSLGHSVEIIDAYATGMSWSGFEQRIQELQPEVLGFSAMTPVADVVARAIRLCRPHAGKIVLGGPHPTAVGDAVFTEMPGLDAAVIGEGEPVIGPLLDWWTAGSPGDPPPGVRAPNRAFTAASPMSPSDLPRPARDLLPNDAYRYLFATRRGFATMISSRGCPFRCSFCDKSVGGSKWRARSARDVVDEMAELKAEFGVGFINFYDDNFTISRRRVMDICDEIIRRGLDIEWKCEGRVDSVDPELLSRMRAAGCRVVAYGVESANPETLALLRKDITVPQAISAFAQTKAAGLRSLAYMILGAPGEDHAAVEASIQFCRDIEADYVQFSTLSAMPGTPLFSHPRSLNSNVNNPLDADVDRNTLTDMDGEELGKLVRAAWLGFYLRPRPMARLLRDAVASGSIDEVWRMGRALGRWHSAA